MVGNRNVRQGGQDADLSKDPVVQALSRAIIDNANTNSKAISEAPSWLQEVLEALTPLRALAPVHGKLPKEAAEDLKGIRTALARVDMSNARKPGGGLRSRSSTPAKAQAS